MGHAKIMTTINTYTHAIKSKDTAAADLLDNIITVNRKTGSDEGD